MAARRVAFRKKRQNRLGMFSVTIVVLILLGVLVFKSMELKAKYNDYEVREATLQAQIDDETARTKKLEEYENAVVYYSTFAGNIWIRIILEIFALLHI